MQHAKQRHQVELKKLKTKCTFVDLFVIVHRISREIRFLTQGYTLRLPEVHHLSHEHFISCTIRLLLKVIRRDYSKFAIFRDPTCVLLLKPF